jgi:indolepyruvate ferredoxin oxidoreductase
VQKLLQRGQVIHFTPPKTQSVDALVQHRFEFLTRYQNAAYAQRYRAFVEQVRQAEEACSAGKGSMPLTQAVARYLFKLMAYKDEYEVARLHTDSTFRAQIESQFEGDFSLHYHLAPPLLARKNHKGELQKSRFGPWMGLAFRFLAPFKVLRGTALDVFGYSAERRQERALIAQYQATLAAMLPHLTPVNLPLALEFARLPEQLRGFGHVKERHWLAIESRWGGALAQFHQFKSEAA